MAKTENAVGSKVYEASVKRPATKLRNPQELVCLKEEQLRHVGAATTTALAKFTRSGNVVD